MRLLLLMMILMAGIATPGCAQDGFVQQNGASLSYNVFDKDGKTFVNPAPDVAGSPFYKDDWRLGQLILNDNRRYDSVRVRLNLSSQEVHILDRNNTEIALARGYIKEILWPHYSETRFRNGFPPVDNQDATSFYAVLSVGKRWLLESIRKVITERKDDLSGEVSRGYTTYEDDYIYDGKTMLRVKENKAFLLAALSDKRDLVAGFIGSHKLKIKSADEVKQVVDYYNMLP
jgi:hypothetical protein